MERWDVDGGDKGKRKMKEGDHITNFFVIEFGDQWKAKDLFFKFKDLGDIDEVAFHLEGIAEAEDLAL